jgi:hypothetical protein
MRYCCLLVALPLLMVLATARPAAAIPNFAKVFKKDYLDNNAHKEFATEAGKPPNSCLVCHQGLKNRKNRNAFGLELSKLLNKKEDSKPDEKTLAKVSEAIKKVLAMHVDPKDDKSETYLDRVKAGKYPVGTLEELKKEGPPPTEEPAKE